MLHTHDIQFFGINLLLDLANILVKIMLVFIGSSCLFSFLLSFSVYVYSMYLRMEEDKSPSVDQIPQPATLKKMSCNVSFSKSIMGAFEGPYVAAPISILKPPLLIATKPITDFQFLGPHDIPQSLRKRNRRSRALFRRQHTTLIMIQLASKARDRAIHLQNQLAHSELYPSEENAEYP